MYRLSESEINSSFKSGHFCCVSAVEAKVSFFLSEGERYKHTTRDKNVCLCIP